MLFFSTPSITTLREVDCSNNFVFKFRKFRRWSLLALCGAALTGCQPATGLEKGGVKPLSTYPVTNNDTPYSQCLKELAQLPANNLPVFSVGEVADKTGQINLDDNGRAISQGISEMVISALFKTRKANLVERLDLRIPLAEMKLAEQERLSRKLDAYDALPASDFIVVGALTELNYNISSGGAQLYVKGIGGGVRTVVINVALDLRVVVQKLCRAIRLVLPKADLWIRG